MFCRSVKTVLCSRLLLRPNNKQVQCFRLAYTWQTDRALQDIVLKYNIMQCLVCLFTYLSNNFVYTPLGFPRCSCSQRIAFMLRLVNNVTSFRKQTNTIYPKSEAQWRTIPRIKLHFNNVSVPLLSQYLILQLLYIPNIKNTKYAKTHWFYTTCTLHK